MILEASGHLIFCLRWVKKVGGKKAPMSYVIQRDYEEASLSKCFLQHAVYYLGHVCPPISSTALPG